MFGSGNMGQNNWGGAVPLSDGLDTRPCKILDLRLLQSFGCMQGKKWAGTRRYGVPADAISVPADSASEIVKFKILIPRESCANAKSKYSSSVVPPDPSVHFYHWMQPKTTSGHVANPS